MSNSQQRPQRPVPPPAAGEPSSPLEAPRSAETGPAVAVAVADGEAVPKSTSLVVQLSEGIIEYVKNENWAAALAAYEQLRSLDELPLAVEHANLVTRAWGRAIVAAEKVGGGGEHLEEMADDFEAIFGYRSPYLQGVLFGEQDPCTSVEELMQKNGLVSPDAIHGILDRVTNIPPDRVRALLNIVKQLNIPMTEFMSSKLQKIYVFRMKDEDPEAVFEEMMNDGVRPTFPHAYNMVLSKHPSRRTMMEYYENMLDNGIQPLPSTWRIMLHSGALNSADSAMIRRRLRGETAPEDRYLQQILCQQQDGDVETATKIYKRMLLEGMVPDKYVYNYLIQCCRRDPMKAEEWYLTMLRCGVQPNAVTFTNLITVWKDSKMVESCDRWIAEMHNRGIKLDAHNYSALLDAYVRAGFRSKTQQLFRGLVEKNEITDISVYNVVMKLGPFDWSLGCLACLLADGMQPTVHTRSTMQSLARDDVSDEILEELSRCEWRRENILSSDKLVSPPKGTTPSLQDTLRFIMREIGMESDAIASRTRALTDAVASVRASAKGPSS